MESVTIECSRCGNKTTFRPGTVARLTCNRCGSTDLIAVTGGELTCKACGEVTRLRAGGAFRGFHEVAPVMNEVGEFIRNGHARCYVFTVGGAPVVKAPAKQAAPPVPPEPPAQALPEAPPAVEPPANPFKPTAPFARRGRGK